MLLRSRVYEGSAAKAGKVTRRVIEQAAQRELLAVALDPAVDVAQVDGLFSCFPVVAGWKRFICLLRFEQLESGIHADLHIYTWQEGRQELKRLPVPGLGEVIVKGLKDGISWRSFR